MKRLRLALLIWLALLCVGAQAQSLLPADAPALQMAPAAPASLVSKPSLPRMSPEIALATYQRRTAAQAEQLAAYSDSTLMQAELPDTLQKGEYQLKRQYKAPRTLEYTPIKFTGDGFVRSNVFLRLLQSEVEHVTKQQGEETAITDRNYKFAPKSLEEVDGRQVYVFQVKPRSRRVGLFKGRVYIDAFTGALRRAEGSIVKSPSWWVKKVDFVQDYDEIGGFNLPVRLHSITRARVIGRAVVDIFHSDYQPYASAVASMPSPSYGGGSEAKSN